MKKLFLAFLFCLIFALSTFATVVTVGAYDVTTTWTFGGPTATVRIWATRTFVTSTGSTVVQGFASGFYRIVPCTVSGSTVSCPSFTIDSTTDSSLPTSAKYIADIYDSTGRSRGRYMDAFFVPPSPTSTTWADLRTANTLPQPTPSPTYYTKNATDSLLAGKQATLISGTNIKTINTQSLLGPGDITISGGGGGSPGGSSGEVQLNNSGSLGGVSGSSFVSGSKLVLAAAPTTVAETSQADFSSGVLSSTQANSDGTLTLSDAANGTTKAVNFNGDRSNQISIPHNTAYNISGDMTIEAWVYLVNPTAFSPILAKGQALTAFDFILQSGGGTGEGGYGWLRFGQGGTYASTNLIASVKLNQWQHVAVVKSGTEIRFYINGVRVGTTTGFSPTVPTNTDALTIGHIIDSTVTAGYLFRGSLYDVRLWNVARSDSDIANNMNVLSSGTPLGHWAMQEGSGTTINDTGSGAHNGTLSGIDYAWQTVTNNFATSGTRTSPIYDISAAKTISTSNIVWNTITPHGHTVLVETRYSTNGGSTFSAYATATSGASIPGLSGSTDLSNGRLQIRETLTSPTSKASPIFSDVTATFTTPAQTFPVGVKNSSPSATLDVGTGTVQGKITDTGGAEINITAARYGAIVNDGQPDDAAFLLAFADLGPANLYPTSTGKIVLPCGQFDLANDLELNHVVIIQGCGGANNAPGTILSFADGKGIKIPACEVDGGYGTGQGCGTNSWLRDLRIVSKGKANAPTATVNVSGLNITRTAGTVFKYERWGGEQIVKIGNTYARILNWLTNSTATLEPLYYKGTVSGSTVTLEFGNDFPAGLSGVSVKIDGHAYTINSSTTSTLTLSSSPAETGVRDIEIQSLGTLTGQTMTIFVNHGIEASGTFNAMDVSVSGFAGNGIDINTANWNYDNARNSNLFQLYQTTAIDNEGHGYFIFSSNANASVLVGANGFNNRGSGIFELSQFGNSYLGPHVDANRMEAFYCSNSSSIVGLYEEGDQPSARFVRNGGVTGPVVVSGFIGGGFTYDTNTTILSNAGPVSGITTLSAEGVITAKSQLYFPTSSQRVINMGYGASGGTESAEVKQVAGGLKLTTNTTADLLTPTDNTKASWSLFVPNGVVDAFKVSRAPAGSTTFTDLLTMDLNGTLNATKLSIGGGSTINKVLSSTCTLDFPSIAANNQQELTCTVTGVAAADQAMVQVTTRNSAPEAGVYFMGYISGSNTVTVRALNVKGTSVDPISTDYMIRVLY